MSCDVSRRIATAVSHTDLHAFGLLPFALLTLLSGTPTPPTLANPTAVSQDLVTRRIGRAYGAKHCGRANATASPPESVNLGHLSDRADHHGVQDVKH